MAPINKTDPQKKSQDRVQTLFNDNLRLYDFHGGIHPPQQKTPASNNPQQTLPLAEKLYFPLVTEKGQPLKATVKIDDRVLTGQVLAEDETGFIPPVHAPASGKIIAIEHHTSAHSSAIQVPMLVLETAADQQWLELETMSIEQVVTTKPEHLIQKIFDAGIVGLGGAAFPTATKLSSPAKINQLILNGAECEPYISCDDSLMQEQATKVLSGALLISHCVGARDIVIAVEDNKPNAINMLKEAREKLPFEQFDNLTSLSIITIPTKYPSGGEKQLIEIITGKQVPKGKFPAHLGLIVQNVATAKAVYDALIEGRPLIDRLVTLTGKLATIPSNYLVPFGTPIEHLLSYSHTKIDQLVQVIMGGPMMGHNISDLKTPILKSCNCIIVPTEDELPSAPAALACIRCGLCTEACPAQLLPQQLYWHSRAEEWDKTEDYNLFDCIECGACAYVCPSQIPLVDYYRFAKKAVTDKKAEQLKGQTARIHHEKKLARLKQLEDEKANRRKQRAIEAQKRKEAAALAKENEASDNEDSSLPIDSEPTSKQLDPKQQAVADAIARVKQKKLEKAQAAEAKASNNANSADINKNSGDPE